MTASGQPLPADVQSALARGNKIEAIKLLRQATGLELKEAKDIVDAAAASFSPLHVPPAGPLPARADKGLWIWLTVVGLLTAYTLWKYL